MLTHSITVDYDQSGLPQRAMVYDYAAASGREILCYAKGLGMTVAQAEAGCAQVKELFIGALGNGNVILTSQFKRAVKAFELPRVLDADYEVYDCCEHVSLTAAPRLANLKLRPWQRLLANASVVYQDMEERGLLHNELPRTPHWGFALTGRSRCETFNVQGIQKDDDVISVIRADNCPEGNALVHFDWIAADCMMMAYMSQDEAMLESFRTNDPYTYLAEELNRPRDECKVMLLRDVYGFNFKSDVFSVYKGLKPWVMGRMHDARNNGRLSTALGRKFRLADDTQEEQRRTLNYTVQGSTAHMMHAVMCDLWRIPGLTLLADLHDGVVFSCSEHALGSVLKQAVSVMAWPIEDVCMAFKISDCKVGDGWHQWRPSHVCKGGRLKSLRKRDDGPPPDEAPEATPDKPRPPWAEESEDDRG